MAQFDYKRFLKEGGIEKYLLEENFGNDIESRYQYIRPLMIVTGKQIVPLFLTF